MSTAALVLAVVSLACYCAGIARVMGPYGNLQVDRTAQAFLAVGVASTLVFALGAASLH